MNDYQKRHKKIVRERIIAVILTLLILGGLITAAVIALPKLVEPILPDPGEEEGGEPEDVLSGNEPAGAEEETGEIEEEEPEIDSEALKEQVEDALSEAEEEDIEPEIKGAINVMTNEQKIAQLFFVTPEAVTKVDPTTAVGERTKETYRALPVGGLIYFAKNFEDPVQTKEMLTDMQRLALSVNSLPVFLGVDEEGGSVVRIADNPTFQVEKVPGMATVGNGGDTGAAASAGRTIGKYLSEYGFNLDFAPVADVLTSDSGFMKERSFGSDPGTVGDMAVSFAGGLAENGIIPCYKHYPGIGDADKNTDLSAVSINRSIEELRTGELVPFRQAVSANACFIMAGHAEYPDIDPGVPASMSSKLIKGVLRDELGYEGIVITDALNAKAVTGRYSPGEAAVAAFNAGCDMLLMPENLEEAYEAMLHAYENGDISNDRLMESLVRILSVKLESGKLPVSAEEAAAVSENALP
ncbi:MAG: hypothetical protein K5985_10760 [Lachnospiraceae bacterium]|nr:hypothetical protein [Lachnospiraceae bacterium]